MAHHPTMLPKVYAAHLGIHLIQNSLLKQNTKFFDYDLYLNIFAKRLNYINNNNYYFFIENNNNDYDKIKYEKFLINNILFNVIFSKKKILLSQETENFKEYLNEKKIKKKYRKLKKFLFSFNNSFSDLTLFYSQNNKIKYKILNHLTKDFIHPLIFPILDFDYYKPFFNCEENNIFQTTNNNNNLFKIDLSLTSFISNNILNPPKNFLSNFIKCCFITNTHHIKCYIYFNLELNYFLLFSININVENFYNKFSEDFDNERENCFGSLFKGNITNKDKDFILKINLSKIKIIFKRKYFYRDNSIEIFTYFNKSYFIKFENEKIRDDFLKKIKENNKNLKEIKEKKVYVIYNSLDNDLKKFTSIEKINELWKNNLISNFQYLMFLNVFANRSFRDLNQYPILPWLFKNFDNFDEDSIDDKIIAQKLSNNIRNMDLPLGMIDYNEKSKIRKNSYIETFNSMVEDLKKEFDIEILKDKKIFGIIKNENNNNNNNNNSNLNEDEDNNNVIDLDSIYKNKLIPFEKIPYYYGSHYSNATYTSHFLTRLFPFTFTTLEIQGGKFDVSERLFLNIIKSFHSISSEKCDLREMIPELYFLPELYVNINKLNLGKIEKEIYFNSSNENVFINNKNLIDVEDVFLPNWSKNNPFKFICFLREIFESENNKINNWIDLIFGVNQTGKKAQKNKNIFLPYCYDNVFEYRNKFQSNYENSNIKEEINTIFRMYEFGVNPIQILDVKIKKKFL